MSRPWSWRPQQLSMTASASAVQAAAARTAPVFLLPIRYFGFSVSYFAGKIPSYAGDSSTLTGSPPATHLGTVPETARSESTLVHANLPRGDSCSSTAPADPLRDATCSLTFRPDLVLRIMIGVPQIWNL
ncbi:hypothetical protein RJ640_003046 [Escallonia rubra]|uniref:Uncharacterized protein n=1 Tax=Escallonia rubra TaxID=112253 RepID=A0AA88UMV1_9ASTE|nr:hypothetical protein RJ640_003046 [Escallonia rubra]